MKNDALTLAVIVFVAGLLISSLAGADFFESESEVPGALQQGVAQFESTLK